MNYLAIHLISALLIKPTAERAFILVSQISRSKEADIAASKLIGIDLNNHADDLGPVFSDSGAELRSEKGTDNIKTYWALSDDGNQFTKAMIVFHVWKDERPMLRTKSIKPRLFDPSVKISDTHSHSMKTVVVMDASGKVVSKVKWKSFITASVRKPTSNCVSVSLSPGETMASLCFEGKHRVIPEYDQREELTYVVDLKTSRVQFVGDGWQTYWLNDSELGVDFKPHLKDHLQIDVESGFVPECYVYNVKTRTRGSTRDFEIIASSTYFRRFLVLDHTDKPASCLQTDENLKPLPLPRLIYRQEWDVWYRNYAVGR